MKVVGAVITGEAGQAGAPAGGDVRWPSRTRGRRGGEARRAAGCLRGELVKG